jgi:triosephosphate isomerase
VVYGGGLKEENAGMLGSLQHIDGGLVALTKFTQPIGFDPDDLRLIVAKYMEKRGEK